jgi:flagellar FliL protein
MAKQKKGDEEEGQKKKRKKTKPIVPIVLLVAGLFAGKTFFGGASATKSPDQIEAEATAAHSELLKGCQEANGMAAERGHAGESVATADGATSAVPSVLEMESVTVNLADAHYLKLGLALQLKPGITSEVAQQEGLGARALDMALERLSAKEMGELVSSEVRAAIKQRLGLDVCLAYAGEVTTVYFTEFVMQ